MKDRHVNRNAIEGPTYICVCMQLDIRLHCSKSVKSAAAEDDNESNEIERKTKWKISSLPVCPVSDRMRKNLYVIHTAMKSEDSTRQLNEHRPWRTGVNSHFLYVWMKSFCDGESDVVVTFVHTDSSKGRVAIEGREDATGAEIAGHPHWKENDVDGRVKADHTNWPMMLGSHPVDRTPMVDDFYLDWVVCDFLIGKKSAGWWCWYVKMM